MPWVLGKLLHGKSRRSKHVDAWDASCRAYLSSTVSGGQWPQARLFGTRRWTTEQQCQLCKAAVGTLKHRQLCTVTRPALGWQSVPDKAKVFADQLSSSSFEALATRGVVIVRANVPPARQEEHIQWVMPLGRHVDESTVTWYIDGSLLDGPRNLLGRTGAGFVGVLDDGELVAYGHATPPRMDHHHSRGRRRGPFRLVMRYTFLTQGRHYGLPG